MRRRSSAEIERGAKALANALLGVLLLGVSTLTVLGIVSGARADRMDGS